MPSITCKFTKKYLSIFLSICLNWLPIAATSNPRDKRLVPNNQPGVYISFALLSCDENDLYKDCLKLVNYGDIFFNILICFYMLIGIVANLVEFISIFCKDDDINPIIKCIDFISLAVLTFSKFLFVRIMENVFLFKMVLSILNCL